MVLAYDDLYSIQYFNQNLQAWWKKNFTSMDELIRRSLKILLLLNQNAMLLIINYMRMPKSRRRDLC